MTKITCDVCGADMTVETMEKVSFAYSPGIELCSACAMDLQVYIQRSIAFGQDLAHSLRRTYPGLVDGETPVSGCDLVDSLTRMFGK